MTQRFWIFPFSFYSIDKEDEMACLIQGCNFLLKNIPDEAFVYQRHGNPEYKFQTVEQDGVYPYLLVNIGSGVSILKVSDVDNAKLVLSVKSFFQT